MTLNDPRINIASAIALQPFSRVVLNSDCMQ